MSRFTCAPLCPRRATEVEKVCDNEAVSRNRLFLLSCRSSSQTLKLPTTLSPCHQMFPRPRWKRNLRTRSVVRGRPRPETAADPSHRRTVRTRRLKERRRERRRETRRRRESEGRRKNENCEFNGKTYWLVFVVVVVHCTELKLMITEFLMWPPLLTKP